MTNSMTIAEKLRFLADREEDGKEFEVYFGYNDKWFTIIPKGLESKIRLANVDSITNMRIKTIASPQWEFTEDEKVILRNLPDDYQWIARDKNDDELYGYTLKPYKSVKYWNTTGGFMTSMVLFNHLFQSIQWSDYEPCEFRKYL